MTEGYKVKHNLSKFDEFGRIIYLRFDVWYGNFKTFREYTYEFSEDDKLVTITSIQPLTRSRKTQSGTDTYHLLAQTRVLPNRFPKYKVKKKFFTRVKDYIFDLYLSIINKIICT